MSDTKAMHENFVGTIHHVAVAKNGLLLPANEHILEFDEKGLYQTHGRLVDVRHDIRELEEEAGTIYAKGIDTFIISTLDNKTVEANVEGVRNVGQSYYKKTEDNDNIEDAVITEEVKRNHSGRPKKETSTDNLEV